MKFLELVEESVSVLRTNRLRTGLSALGIIIGIASVIALMTLGDVKYPFFRTGILRHVTDNISL